MRPQPPRSPIFPRHSYPVPVTKLPFWLLIRINRGGISVNCLLQISAERNRFHARSVGREFS